MKETLLAILHGKIHELPKRELRVVLFCMAFLDYGFHVFWVMYIISSSDPNRVFYGMGITFLWDSMHDSYYTLGADIWRDKTTRRIEKIGSCLGAGASLWLFPNI